MSILLWSICYYNDRIINTVTIRYHYNGQIFFPQLAIISYAKEVAVEFFFDQFGSKEEMKDAIDSIVYVGK